MSLKQYGFIHVETQSVTGRRLLVLRLVRASRVGLFAAGPYVENGDALFRPQVCSEVLPRNWEQSWVLFMHYAYDDLVANRAHL